MTQKVQGRLDLFVGTCLHHATEHRKLGANRRVADSIPSRNSANPEEKSQFRGGHDKRFGGCAGAGKACGSSPNAEDSRERFWLPCPALRRGKCREGCEALEMNTGTTPLYVRCAITVCALCLP